MKDIKQITIECGAQNKGFYSGYLQEMLYIIFTQEQLEAFAKAITSQDKIDAEKLKGMLVRTALLAYSNKTKNEIITEIDKAMASEAKEPTSSP